MSANRTYTVSGSNVTITNASPVTLVWINPPASPNKDLEILRVWCGQRGTATSAQLGVQLSTQVSAFPTVTAATPQAHNRGDTASIVAGGTGAAGTSGINASAEGAGAKTVIIPDNFNNLNGWLWLSTPDEQIVLPAGLASGLGLVLPAAPAVLTGWSFGVTFIER